MDIYADRIKPLFDSSGKTDADLEREIGMPAKKISQWNVGYTKSYTKYIQKIASYFHVSTDYLLGNTDDPTPPEQKESPPHSGEPPKYRQLTPENRAMIDDLIEKLLKSQSGG